MTTDILPTLLEEFYEKLSEAKNSVPREASFPEAEKAIKVAIGMRRAGKTYFTLQKIHALLEEGIPLDSILYLNFEDDRLLPMDNKTMGQLIDAFFTLYPENHKRRCFLFLDEVQNILDWALVIRRFFDTKNVQIYLTGSSAKLLSKEISTSLRGRSLETEIWPYSFAEYLQAHQIKPVAPPLGKKGLDIMRKHLLDYFQLGGFPAVQQLSQSEHLATLQGYVETVIFRDIVERYKISNVALLRYLISVLLKNVGAPFSIHKFYNDIKSQGHRVGKDTLYQYLAYVEDAYLLFAVPSFTDSVRELQTTVHVHHPHPFLGERDGQNGPIHEEAIAEALLPTREAGQVARRSLPGKGRGGEHVQTTPKKIYAVDNGLLVANAFNASSNYGKLFENLIYLELRRQGKKVFYYKTKNGYEIDFVVESKQEKTQLFQVAWELDEPETRKREELALSEAEKELGIPGKMVDFAAYLKGGWM